MKRNTSSPVYKIFAVSFFLFAANTTYSQNYKRVHEKAIVVDTHNDFPQKSIDKNYAFEDDLAPRTHTDLNRMLKGGVDLQLFSIFCDGQYKNGQAFKRAIQQIDFMNATAARSSSRMQLVHSPKEFQKLQRQHKFAFMYGVEGGHMMEDNLSNLDTFYDRGVRYMTLTWNNSTSWASSAADETANKIEKKGLNQFGKQVVKRMNELGIIVDVSHVGEQTFYDVISTTTKPVIASHSSVYALAPVPRNLKDEQIKAIAKNGGVIQVNFYSGFLDSSFERNNGTFRRAHRAEIDSLRKINPEPYFSEEFLFEKYPNEVASLQPPLSLLIQHIDYIVKLVGADHVGLGSDFDGISSAPKQLVDVTSYPLITKALLEKGYSKKDVTKILGGNFMRVWKANSK
jgi:membrane dipeptidase